GLVGPQVAGVSHQVTHQVSVRILGTLTLLGRRASGYSLQYGSLIAAVLVRSSGASFDRDQGSGGSDHTGHSGEGPGDILVEVTAGHEHRGVRACAVGVTAGNNLVLLGDVDDLGPNPCHVEGAEVADTE